MRKILCLFSLAILMLLTGCGSQVNKEESSNLKASQESFENAKKSELNGDYQNAADLYSKVEKDDPNFNEAKEKIELMKKLIESGKAYNEGIQFYSTGEYNSALNSLCKVISDDKNYDDAQQKIGEAISFVKANLIPVLENCKSVNDFNSGLKSIEAVHLIVQSEKEISEYKDYFETKKSEHEAAVALENEKNSYDMNTSDGISGYLKRFYPDTQLCVGKYVFSYEIFKNTLSFRPEDYTINIRAENDYLFADLRLSNEYTQAQKSQAKRELKNFMYTIANDVMNRTTKKIIMRYDGSYSSKYIDGYGYLDGDSSYYCNCSNFAESAYFDYAENLYEKTKRDGFRWWNYNTEAW